MSAIDKGPEPTTPGRARQTLESLRCRWGNRIGPKTELAPLEITIYGMSTERWVRLDGSRGESTVYELEESK